MGELEGEQKTYVGSGAHACLAFMFLLSLQSNGKISEGKQVTLVHFCIKAGRNSFGGVKGQSQGIKASA